MFPIQSSIGRLGTHPSQIAIRSVLLRSSTRSNLLVRNRLHYHSFIMPLLPSQFIQFIHLSSTRQLNKLTILSSKRLISMFPKMIGKIIKAPAYLGGAMAATGSYIAYKVEQTTNYTMDKFGQLHDLSNSMKDKINQWLPDTNVTQQQSNNNGNNGGGSNPDGSVPGAAVLGALADDEKNSDRGMGEEDEEEEEDADDIEKEDNTQDEMLNLTKQMIEIRSILNKVDSSSAHLTLPSIVVIGSQSSGKSSVLESIVGKEFLPKGSNMVTRRPIELTLVNTPNSKEITADFPSQRLYNIKDFNDVKRLLMELNMAVPSTEAVSEDPIQLTIKSSRVPDLSLVDLPGYIQIEAADQPLELKSKIQQLCEKYLKAPNIILAISAADVDLANSSALRAAKTADPAGLRTIGVITKLDLVTPNVASTLLNNKKYPLKMGYVGVITKAPRNFNKGSYMNPFDDSNHRPGASPLGNIFGKKSNSTGIESDLDSNSQLGLQQIHSHQFEKQYFKENKKIFSNCQVSTKRLREKLINILEMSMSNALEPTSSIIQQELDDTSYLFKVEFNDRQLTPKSYLLNNIDVLKLSIKEFQEKFTRNELKSILKADLDQKVLDILAQRYWKDNNLLELSSQLNNEREMLYWHKKLELASSGLTKIGIGRLSTVLVTNSILKELQNILDETQLRNHDLIKDLVNNTAINVLNAKYYSTADQVENCIKPFKYEIDLEDRDWSMARTHSIKLIKEELAQCNEQFNTIKNSVGAKKLNRVMTYLENDGSSQKETLGMSKILLERGGEATFLQKRTEVLNFRLKMLKNKCYSSSEKDRCPEVFLNAVNEKLTATAVLFLNVELLSDFFYNFPIELDKKLGTLNNEQIEMFAKEDPKVARHIELQKRKELLELALQKIDSILVFKRSYRNLGKN
ncbi:similar to Saccharomyces cerevisiae YOR211C MGM1 Mitochondrial GTPase, present in complex with Ugo1p and Fzo1p [Maudiozyma barnettii]|uniref:dynamin GTPase n=1 Tax=Maudiozyma barnettii TaxID=61262 RepID=A0A8H2ZGH4_9SACH|nr:dynamin-related GTPase MGM1 [Kazachstania barnettii]CAB4253643.1 similar to Saccharomyces cerevisiae YOR211C MGM1 Mitochondrial GTPase, present in complex with Ugo1p and Fzo1p [Kazachstania barnettii]CAD1781320.1 similar to Saccharomyces cerevisiae YOR211C MGM1 Mitochondrial GTPase, present in complex with Ugo1p and Fzo1p [Kazachstania barnettii]